jgi:Carboxypeptidase regulatory-like domain/TonB dependent receptor
MLWLVAATPALLRAQESASLTGVVTDNSGAVVPDVDVQLVDTKTSTTYETHTNSVGTYTFPSVVPGPGYKIIFTKPGFAKVEVGRVYLAVNAPHTQNAQLEVGTVSQTVEVSGAGQSVTLNTSDATIGNNFDMRSLHELPIQVRDSPAALLTLQPGVATAEATGDDPNSSRQGAVTGARTDQGNVTLDGLDVNDFGTGQAFSTVANAPVDSIQEFRGETANPLAASGRGSGAQINLVTKSGSNEWHGSAYEYHRNTVMEANDFFNNQNGLPVPKLIRNQFGANLGGPVIKDKLFFFFNYQGRRDAREDSVTHIVPLDSFRNGSVSYINDGPGCTASSRADSQPACITTLSPAQVAAIDPLGVGADPDLLTFITGRYPHANDLSLGDGVNTGGFRFNAPVARSENDYVSRIDYNFNSKMKMFGRFSILRDDGGDDTNFSAPIQFPGDPLTHSIVDHSWAWVVGHTWTITNNVLNQFTVGETRSVLSFPTSFNPTGINQFNILMNNGQNSAGITQPFSDGSSQSRSVPIPVFRDDFNWVHGKHSWQFGGTFKPIKSHDQLVNDFNSVTMGLGGGLSSLTPDLQPLDLLQDQNAAASNMWDSAFTFSLGRIGNISSNFNNNKDLQPLAQGSGHIRDYRYYETEVYAQDAWKIRSDLTVTYGLRYQYYSVPYEVNGLEAVPSLGFADFINPRLAAGPISSLDPLPNVSYTLGGKANHGPALYGGDWKDFSPRVSFAYNPSVRDGILGKIFGDGKTVLRGGAGLIFDHTATSALNFLQDQNTYILQGVGATTFPLNPGDDARQTLIDDPRFSSTGALPPLNPFPTVTVPFTPDPNGTADGAGLFNYAIDPHLKTPYSETFTFGFQRELPGNFLLEANYFGRLGHRLLAQADAGQVVNFKDPTSGQNLAKAFGNLAQEVRKDPTNLSFVTDQPFFDNQVFPGSSLVIASALEGLVFRGDLGDTVQALDFNGLLAPGIGLHPQFGTNLYITNKAYSNYNGLLMTLHKRASHGLQFDLNYTYSHSIDNISAPANQAFGSNGAGGIICDAINTGICRGNSDFDVRHIITANGLYELPIGKGKALAGNIPGWANQVIGGWQISGILTWHTGLAFQTVANSFPISFANNVPAIFNGDNGAIKSSVHVDPSTGQVQLFAHPEAALVAFSFPTGLEAGDRNNLRGPMYTNVDLGLSKHFPIRESMGFEFRADAYNVFNHVNFSLPGVSATADISAPSSFGVISSDAGARVLQLALRFDF